MAFVSLAIIALVAFASPFIASAIPGKPVPETVFLLVLGAVLGPHMLGVIHVDAEVSLVSELGLAFLFLLAGFEIDPKSITGVEGRYGLATWVVTFCIAWLAVRFTPWFSVSHFDGIAVTLALTSTALGTLVPIMRERSLTGTRVGDSILAYGTWGELGPVLAMSVLLSARTGIQTLVILGLFAVVCVLLAVVPSRSKRVGSRFFAFVEERADTTSQTFVRLTVLILVTLVAFSAVFDLDIVLGSFAAGFVLRYIIPEGNHTLETKLDGLAYGFLIPVFFTVSGAKIDLTAVASRPGLLVGFIVALLIIRAVPILISMSICPATRDVSAYGRITVALYCTTALPIIVAVTSVAVNAGALSQDIASGHGCRRCHHGVLDAIARAALLPRGGCRTGRRRGRGCRASIRCARHLARPPRPSELARARARAADLAWPWSRIRGPAYARYDCRASFRRGSEPATSMPASWTRRTCLPIRPMETRSTRPS